MADQKNGLKMQLTPEPDKVHARKENGAIHMPFKLLDLQQLSPARECVHPRQRRVECQQCQPTNRPVGSHVRAPMDPHVGSSSLPAIWCQASLCAPSCCLASSYPFPLRHVACCIGEKTREQMLPPPAPAKKKRKKKKEKKKAGEVWGGRE